MQTEMLAMPRDMDSMDARESCNDWILAKLPPR
jgi:hypothetical protein